MAHLRDVCDPSLVDGAIGTGLVSVHTDGRLRILNYTAKATYSRHWNEATIACRGLILDDTDGVVARPFPKFFGPSEPDAPAIPAHQEMEVTAKLDGSLGIAYTRPEGDVRLATRGSLASKQAREAAIDADDDSNRAFAVAAQRLAADSDVHPGPIFALRKGRADARLAVWGQTKPSGHGDPATVSSLRDGPHDLDAAVEPITAGNS